MRSRFAWNDSPADAESVSGGVVYLGRRDPCAPPVRPSQIFAPHSAARPRPLALAEPQNLSRRAPRHRTLPRRKFGAMCARSPIVPATAAARLPRHRRASPSTPSRSHHSELENSAESSTSQLDAPRSTRRPMPREKALGPKLVVNCVQTVAFGRLRYGQLHRLRGGGESRRLACQPTRAPTSSAPLMWPPLVARTISSNQRARCLDEAAAHSSSRHAA